MAQNKPTSAKNHEPFRHPATHVIDAERKRLRLSGGEQPTGIAISGGGIRSASFSIGILQAMNAVPGHRPRQPAEPVDDQNETASPPLPEATVLDDFDYLSTVSGGGFSGTALSWYRHTVGPRFFPFGVKFFGTRSLPDPRADVTAGETPKTQIAAHILAYLRQHANYLMPTGWLDLVSIVATVLRGALVRSVYYILVIASAFWGLLALAGLVFPNQSALRSGINAWLTRFIGSAANAFSDADASLVALGLFVIVFLTILFVFIAFVRALFPDFFLAAFAKINPALRSASRSYGSSIITQGLAGSLIKFALLSALLVSLPLLRALFVDWVDAAGVIGVLAGAAAAFTQFRSLLGKAPFIKNWTKAGDYAVILGAALFTYAILIGAYSVGRLPMLGIDDLAARSYPAQLVAGADWWWPLLLLFAGAFIPIKESPIGRMYRDRLMETFMQTKKQVTKNRWHPATEADKAELSGFCLTEDRKTAIRPYHLINSNVVLVDDPDVKYRSRGGDNFLLSPLYVGSNATGYRLTKGFMAYIHGSIARELTAATAMAISGAAANPNTGVGGSGQTRNGLVSFLMTFFAIRLGFWAFNPRTSDRLTATPPTLIRPGLSSLFSLGYNSHNTYLDLSDGGHFENLGLYELIRRKCRLIVVMDGGCDPTFGFADLGTATERVRVDFGARIRFPWSKYGLPDMMPDSSREDTVFADKFKLAERGFALARVTYPAQTAGESSQYGLIIYLKLTMTDDLPADLYSYKAKNSDFPDQSTADQFFDEEQFEAYRELGYRIMKHCLADKAVIHLMREVMAWRNPDLPDEYGPP